MTNEVDDREQVLVRHLAAVVSGSDEPILSTGADLRILTWNGGARQLFGYSDAEVLGRPLSTLISDRSQTEMNRLAERARGGRPVQNHELKALRRDGVPVDVAVTLSPIPDPAGGGTGLAVVVRDITEQRWMATALGEMLTSLEAALDQARESEARYRRLMADVAHQLRSPIAAIQASAETLLLNPPSTRRDAMLADVVREAVRAGKALTGLLTIARLDHFPRFTPEPCHLVKLCVEEADRIQATAPAVRVEVVVHDVPASPPELDVQAVREVLTNLLDNARRHAAGHIQIVLDTMGDGVRIVVSDDGPGIPPEVVEAVFERFVSLDGRGGSGLGLAIARELARSHGGDLRWEDGAFAVTLPHRPPPSAPAGGNPLMAARN